MMGRTHALSGAVAGAGVAAWAYEPRPVIALAAVVTAGAALLPDSDHPDGSVARTCGPLTQGFAWLVGKVSGGHRHLTHSLLGCATFTAISWVFAHYRWRWVLALLLALLLASALRALRIRGPLAELGALAGAAALAWTCWQITLLPWAVGIGCVAHLLGDGATREGIPLFAPLLHRRVHLLGPVRFTTGHLAEKFIAAVLCGSMAALAVQVTGLADVALWLYRHAGS